VDGHIVEVEMPRQFVSSVLSTIKKVLNFIHQLGIDSLKKQIENLEKTLRRVQATIKDVEHREIHDEAIKLWLKELKRLASDVKDVLDEYQYELLRCQLEVKPTVTITPFSKVDSLVYDSGPNTARVNADTFSFSESISVQMIQKIREINSQYDDISRDREALRLTSEEGKRRGITSSINFSISSHLMNKDDIFGRSYDKEKVIDLLLSGILWDEEGEDQFRIIQILGMGGIGKTTLAQMVYDDPFVKSIFDVMAWIYVSPEFDVVRLTKEVSEFVTGELGSSFDGFSKIQEVLRKELVGKKMILVLDDVWNMQQNDWEMLFLPLKVAKFVRVLVTSRNDSVVQTLHSVTPYRLNLLPEHECWKLFEHCAFGGKNKAKREWSEEIGRRIIKKCGGLPLAVKCIGGVLHYNRDKESWKEILDSELWESDELNPVFRALKVSYYHLPYKLRDCFLFCSLFPKGSRLRKIEIIYMWMAHGFLQPKGRKRAEDLGEEYLDELQMRSFILLGAKGSFILHDVIYDLAKSLSVGEIHTIMDEKSSNLSDKTRHLYIKKGNKPCPSFRPCLLRTLFNASLVPHSSSIRLTDILLVRVLGLIGSNVDALTSSSCRLKHLRYIGIKEVDFEELPDSICLLYNLQTLKLSYCYRLRELPSNISNLVNLRYLHISYAGIEKLPSTLWQVDNLQMLHLEECSYLKLIPPGISGLRNLHILRLKSCRNLYELPSDIGTLINLKILDLSFSGIRTFPASLRLVLKSSKLDLVGAPKSLRTSFSLDQVYLYCILCFISFPESKSFSTMYLYFH
jgi:NB-ARC domain/Rx N-terminal domain